MLFSTEMVKAILNGAKHQTRRVIKPQPGDYITDDGYMSTLLERCPYGQPGDRIYVKETWKVMSINDISFTMVISYKADVKLKTAQFGPERYEQFKKFFGKNGWQSSCFMPKEAARLWLNNEGVRVEMLQDISEEDARAEGVKDPYDYQKPEYYEQPHMRGLEINKSAFAGLWDSLNAPRGFSWDVNPWIWVISFKRVSD